jgi:hypothetical protein
MKKNAEALLDASTEVGLEVNAEKTEFLTCSCRITSLQDKIIIRQVINSLKIWQRSYNREKTITTQNWFEI